MKVRNYIEKCILCGNKVDKANRVICSDCEFYMETKVEDYLV